ncbi:hypothetical protein GCM10008983_01540 [Lentibacillus halophilus]|uniref:Uncharacterized protein n=1 Tax=Lentibacillus halophilus TaxID=295065 RepID=A0ABP3IVQ8_9BACI
MAFLKNMRAGTDFIQKHEKIFYVILQMIGNIEMGECVSDACITTLIIDSVVRLTKEKIDLARLA